MIATAEPIESPAFELRLDNFEGPFDLLLSLIASTSSTSPRSRSPRSPTSSSAMSSRRGGRRPRRGQWDLEQTSSFLLVAATLLDLKAARLLPQGDVEDEEDLALLEARDLLFARLLQYRAFKQVAAVLATRLAGESRRHPRAVGLEERFATLLPEVLIGIGLDQFAQLAAKAMEPKPEVELSLHHIHAPRVSVREQAALVVDRLRRSGHDDVPGALRRLTRHADDRRALPVAARAVPRGRGRVRPGQPARRADGPLDRRRERGGRGPGPRRVRRRAPR